MKPSPASVQGLLLGSFLDLAASRSRHRATILGDAPPTARMAESRGLWGLTGLQTNRNHYRCDDEARRQGEVRSERQDIEQHVTLRSCHGVNGSLIITFQSFSLTRVKTCVSSVVNSLR